MAVTGHFKTPLLTRHRLNGQFPIQRRRLMQSALGHQSQSRERVFFHFPANLVECTFNLIEIYCSRASRNRPPTTTHRRTDYFSCCSRPAEWPIQPPSFALIDSPAFIVQDLKGSCRHFLDWYVVGYHNTLVLEDLLLINLNNSISVGKVPNPSS